MDKIRKVEVSDLDTICNLEQIFFLDYWSKDQILNQISCEKNINFCIESDSKIVAYIFARYYLDFTEILKIGVSRGFRKVGLASILMKEIELLCLNMKIKKILLEVREANIAAVSLYKKLNYKIDGIRKNYYKKYNEDGILMSKKLI
jgi:ribosomal-protein-alanine acetyltransferase